MSLRWFDCDAGRVEVKDCLAGCPLGRRCLTKPTLVEIATEREWTGKASTTQLLNGTALSWLKLTQDYGISPKSRAFALLGTRHHARLEEVAKELGLPTEVKLDGEITGIVDLIEIENGEIVLSDLKTFGSFKVKKCLGLEEVTRGRWWCNPKLVDMLEVELQLNKYRVELEKQLGIIVDRMQIQVTVRDGGLWSATKSGITENMYLIPVSKMADEEVEKYFNKKAKDLGIALACGWTEKCSDWESWSGKRCEKICEVREQCRRILG